MSIGETLFRKRLSTQGEMFVSRIIEDCPSRFNPFFTDRVPQLRVHLNAGRQRRLLVLAPSKTGFLCKTLATVEDCRVIGFDAKPCSSGEQVMAASFWLDPTVHGPAMLFEVLDAATRSLVQTD